MAGRRSTLVYLISVSYLYNHWFSLVLIYIYIQIDRFVFIFTAEPLPLMDLCRRSIRQKIGRVNLEDRIQQLQLPQSMKTYLLYKNRR